MARVRIYREEAGTFSVLVQPRTSTGMIPVMTKGVKKEDIGGVVDPIVQEEAAIKEAVKQAKAGPTQV